MTTLEIFLLRIDSSHVDADFKRLAQRFGVWLAQNQGLPKRILHSDTAMTELLAEKMAKAMGGSGHLLESVAPQLEAVSCVLNGMDLMVAEAELNDSLLDYWYPSWRTSLHLSGTPAVLIGLELERGSAVDALSCIRINTVVTPDQLPQTFPYPDLQGSEQRPRPAYYYRQSAVIPFRGQGANIEVLLITNSKRRRWLVPKGIHEPGMSAQESAAKEALEEAGVSGTVLASQLGRYQYEKWGGLCEVAVYPLWVEEELSEQDWQESHRLRRWCNLDQAKGLLDNPALAAMLERLPSLVKFWGV